jgi:hypothetical protein
LLLGFWLDDFDLRDRLVWLGVFLRLRILLLVGRSELETGAPRTLGL